jgi:hypothetical protein
MRSFGTENLKGREKLGETRCRCDNTIKINLLVLRPVEGTCKHGNKPSGLVKDGKFLDYIAE